MEAVRQVPKAAPPKPGGAASWALMAVLVAVGAAVALWDAGEVPLPKAEVAGELVTVGAPVAGRLAELAVVEGGELTKGQRIGRLDDDDRRMAVARAEAELAVAEGGFKATRTGVSVQRSQLVSRIAQARSGVQVAASALSGAEARSAQARLDLDTLRKGLTTGGTAVQQVQAAETAVKTADAEVGAAKSKLAIAHAALRLAEAGEGELAVTRAGLETGQAGIGKARAELEAARLRLAEGTIPAPTAGRVARVLVHAGEQVALGQPLCTVATGRVWVEAQAGEAVLDRLRVGAPAHVSFLVRPGEELAGKVEAIGAVLEHPMNGTTPLPPVARVRIALQSSEPWLRPGMSASVRVAR